VTGSNFRVGHKLDNCTDSPAISPFFRKHKGSRIALIDTPGFDDDEKTDAAILLDINKFIRDR
jgi:hypothetical protein